MPLRTLTGTALLALLLATAGCSSDANDTATTTPGTAGGGAAATNAGNAGLPDCPTSAAVSAALGITYGDLVQTGSAKERGCAYQPSSVETGSAALTFQLLAGASDFAGVKAGYSAGRTVAAINGLGEEAFSSVLNSAPSPKNTVAARKGLTMVLVSSFATVDKEKALVASLLGS